MPFSVDPSRSMSPRVGLGEQPPNLYHVGHSADGHLRIRANTPARFNSNERWILRHSALS